MTPITIPNISIPTIGIPTIGIPSVGFPSASGGGLVWPKGLKESIKAIYDPAKQGMTNYDVIEAYVEDFTTWRLDNSGISSTQKKIVIAAGTDLKYVIAFRGFGHYTTGFDIKYTGNLVITYIYNKEDGTTGIITINRSGIYHLPASIKAQKNFGFYCNPQTVTEEATIEQLPTSILKDFSGNGNHAYLYGGKGKLNSGMGIYKEDFTSYGYKDAVINPFTAILTNNTKSLLFYYNVMTKDIESYNVKINGIVDEHIIFFYRNEEGIEQQFHISKDGNYAVPKCYRIGTSGVATGYTANNTNENTKITITQIPDYPNQLCYDGKMYAVCYGFPILEDYTIMADRTWFKNVGCFAGKRSASDNKGAFVFENNSSNGFVCYNYGGVNNINRVDNKITYQTIHDYNGQAINRANSVDTDFLLIGGGLYRPTTNSFDEFWQGCHGKIIIADRSLTEDEITWLKNNLFTIEIPTPAYDFDFSKLKSGENTFTDKYGNELSLYNFQWAGMSGKDGYIEDFAVWGKNTERYTGSITNKTINITEVSKANSICVYTSPKKQNIKLYITGLITGQNIILGNADVPSTVGNIIVSENGLYDIDESQFNQYFGIGFGFTGDCNITITQLPLYPNALVFDGVDDYCKLPKMTIKSVILDVVPLYIGNDMLYDCRTGGDMNAFGIYNEADIVAYSARNDGKTYINGELNTTLTALDIGINRQIVCVTNDNAVEHEQFIGSSISVNSVAKMALYRITGFTEVLTPDQVWKWYQKNKPKGGDK